MCYNRFLLVDICRQNITIFFYLNKHFTSLSQTFCCFSKYIQHTLDVNGCLNVNAMSVLNRIKNYNIRSIVVSLLDN